MPRDRLLDGLAPMRHAWAARVDANASFQAARGLMSRNRIDWQVLAATQERMSDVPFGPQHSVDVSIQPPLFYRKPRLTIYNWPMPKASKTVRHSVKNAPAPMVAEAIESGVGMGVQLQAQSPVAGQLE